jgi:hypothetical protein
LYKAAWGIVACIFSANALFWYLISRYFSVRVPDKAHPITVRFNGTVLHISSISHWLFAGSFVATFIAILSLVVLGLYYRATGVAAPPMRDDDIIQLKLKN